MKERLKSIPVEEFTTPSPFVVEEGTGVNEIVELMREQGFRHVPVITKEKIVGIVSDRDVKLASGLPQSSTLTASDIMSEVTYIVDPNTPLDEVALEMAKSKHGSTIVQGEDGEFAGIFTVTDALNALVEVIRGDV